MRRAALVLGIAAAVLLGAVAAAQSIAPTRSVVSGGVSRASSAGIIMDGTLGQPLIGTSASGPIRLASGFWPDVSPATQAPSATPQPATTAIASMTAGPTATPTLVPTATPRPGQRYGLLIPVSVQNTLLG